MQYDLALSCSAARERNCRIGILHYVLWSCYNQNHHKRDIKNDLFSWFFTFSNFCPIVIALPFILDACPKGHLGRSQKTLTQFWEDALNPIPPHLEFSPQKRCSKSKSKLGNSIALHQHVFFYAKFVMRKRSIVDKSRKVSL